MKFQHKPIKVDLEMMLDSYVSDMANKYYLSTDEERVQVDLRVYDFLYLVFGNDKSSKLYCKYLNKYEEEKDY